MSDSAAKNANTNPNFERRMLNMEMRADMVDDKPVINGVAAVYNRFQYVEEMRAAVREWETRLAALLNQA